MIIVREQKKVLELSALFSWFIIYSCIGWVFESTYCSIDAGRIVNRGFLFGPLCPIYGVTILLMIILLSNRCKSIITLFFSCAVIATLIEYFVSVGMETLFGRRWWDYSDKLININGRICLGASVLFGICGVLIVQCFHPNMEQFLKQNFTVGTINRVNKVLLMIFVFDILVSIQAL